MRTPFLVVALVLAAQTDAQNWCAPGATWVYEYTGWGTDLRRAHHYVGDTTAYGQDALVVEIHTFGYSGGNLDYFDTVFNAVDGEVVLQWKSGIGWDTLYWFGEIGDRWWPLESPMTCPPFGMLEIVDTSSVILDGVPLRKWLVAYLDEQGQSFGWDFQLMERLGSVPPVPQINDCGGVIDYFFCEFMCYADTELTTNDPSYCAIDVAIADETGFGGGLVAFPNPATDVIRLSWAGADGPFEVRVMDASARVVLISTESGQAELSIGELSSGAYVVHASDKRGRSAFTRLFKP